MNFILQTGLSFTLNMLVDFYGENPGRENGRKAVVWPGGEKTVAKGMERRKELGIFKGKKLAVGS